MSWFNSVMEKHRQSLMAARIQVETEPTVDSTEGLSLGLLTLAGMMAV
jgi:hypothetical protein